MAGKTAKEAVDNFLQPLQRAVSCVTRTVLLAGGGYYPRTSPHVVTLGDGGPVRLSADSHLSLSVTHHYRVVEDSEPHRGPWKVSSSGYLYSLEDGDGREIISYHWHPTERSRITSPHLHLGAGAKVGYSHLVTAHLPTGRIALEQILRLAITELDVQPLRADWEQILNSTQQAYEEWRTWPGSAPNS
jgi:hypothetical protein